MFYISMDSKLEKYLAKKKLTDFYEKTKTLYKNFWAVVETDSAFFIFIHPEIMKLMDPAPNLSTSMSVLAPISDIAEHLKSYPNISYAFLYSHQSAKIFEYPDLLEALNEVEPEVMKVCTFSESFIEKLAHCLEEKSLQKSQVTRLTENIYIADTQTFCIKFITFLGGLVPSEFVRHIAFYTRNDGRVLQAIEKNFDDPREYYLRFTTNTALDIASEKEAEYFYDSLFKAEWKNEAISNLFNSFNANLLGTIDQLKLIDLMRPDYYESLMTGLLNLLAADNISGYKRMQLLLSIFIKEQKFSTFLNQLKYFAQDEVNLVFMKLSQTQVAPSNFFALSESMSVSVLKELMDPKENLFWILEKNNNYSLFFNSAGEAYIDLIEGLRNLFEDAINAWLSIWNRYPNVLTDMQLLSKTTQRAIGFPHLLSGIFAIGDYEEPAVTPSEIHVQSFLNYIFIRSGGQSTPRNICWAIESLEEKAKRFVAFIKDKPLLIQNISFDEDKTYGREKSKVAAQFLCGADSKVMRKVSRYLFNQEGIKDLIDPLFYQNDKGSFDIASGFLNAIEKNSNPESILADVRSFMVKTKADAFGFVRMLERISGPEVAFQKFDTWLQSSAQEREALMAKMGSFSGDELRNFIINFAGETQVGELLGSLTAVKDKSSKLYDGLMAIFSQIPSKDFKELSPMIEHKVALITQDSDILKTINSAEIDYDKARTFLTSLSPNLIDSIHEAFTGEEDVAQTVTFTAALLDKDFIIEALNSFSVPEAKLLIQAFTENETFLKKTLYTINEFGYEGGGLKKIKSLLKEFLWIEERPEHQRLGVAPIPLRVCANFINATADLPDAYIWEQLAYPGLIRAFEKTLENEQTKKIVRALLRDRTFMFVLSCVEAKEKLIEHMCNLYRNADVIYLKPIYTAHYMLFDALGEGVSLDVLMKLDSTPEVHRLLEAYSNTHLDPGSRLLSCAMRVLYDSEYKELAVFKRLLTNNIGMRDALCRLYNWKRNTFEELILLMEWIKKRFVKGNDKFKFPSHQNIVIQDDYLYQWLEAAKTSAKGGSTK